MARLTLKEQTDKARVMVAFDAWVSRPAGLRSDAFVSHKVYGRVTQQITRERERALDLIEFVSMEDGIKAEDLMQALNETNCGRLQFNGRDLYYTEPDYQPFEYRHAACAVLAYAVFSHWRKVLASDEDIIEYSRLHFPEYTVQFYFQRGFEALHDLRDEVWDVAAKAGMRTMPRPERVLGRAA